MTTPQMEWVEVSRGFLRDTTGRFEVWHAPAKDCWVAWDFAVLDKMYSPTLADAQLYCETRRAVFRRVA